MTPSTNNRFIMAAVDACQGIPIEALEQGIVQELIERLELAIDQLEGWLIGFPPNSDDTPEVLALLYAALAKAKGTTIEDVKR